MTERRRKRDAVGKVAKSLSVGKFFQVGTEGRDSKWRKMVIHDNYFLFSSIHFLWPIRERFNVSPRITSGTLNFDVHDCDS